MPTQQFLKVTTTDGTPVHGGDGRWPLPRQRVDGSWEPGAWWDVGSDPVACHVGLHLTTVDMLALWVAAEPTVAVWLAQADESLPIVTDVTPHRLNRAPDKYAVRRARLLRLVRILTPVDRAELARRRSHSGYDASGTTTTDDVPLIQSWISATQVAPLTYRPPWAQVAKVVFGYDRDDDARRQWARQPSEATIERQWRKWLARPLYGTPPDEAVAWRLHAAVAAARKAGAEVEFRIVGMQRSMPL